MVRDMSGKRPEYYESILQLRDCSSEVVEFVKEETAREKIHVAKEAKVKGGKDFYLGDGRFTKALGKKLQSRFGGKMEVTASLWGRKGGKDVYRVTVLFREIGFKKGDRVMYGGEDYVIKLMLEKELMLQKVKGGEKVHVRYREMDKIKKKEK